MVSYSMQINPTLGERLTLARLREVYARLGWPVFERGFYNLNFGGVRARERTADTFNDWLYMFYRPVESSEWVLDRWPATLDPGLPWLRQPMAQGGAAVVAPGFYRGLWQVGPPFRGRPCLRQRTPITIYRDDTRDARLDLDPATLERGMYGIFVHPHFQSREQALLVGRSSAGCIVPARNADFNRLHQLCDTSARLYGNAISFGVLHEEQLDALA